MTKLTLTIDQLALAVFTEEYRHQRTRTDDTALAIRKACVTAQRIAELAPEFDFGAPTSTAERAESDIDRARAEDVRDQARREHAERIAETPAHDGVGKLAAFFAENGYTVAQQRVTPKHSVLTLSCGAIVNVWSTGTANVQGKPSDADRRTIVELLRADGWKVNG